jgi:hypothetical protein
MQLTSSCLRVVSFGAVFAAVPLSLHAQSDASDWNHFGLNFRAGFNMRASFSESASFALPAAPGAGAAVNRQYTDGFVNVDSSGNAGGQTWNWGYQDAPQISGGNLLMHASGSASGSTPATADPNFGLDFNYVRDLGHETWGQWGVKVAFGFTPISIQDHAPINASSESITDAYALNGVVPPLAPYSGSFNGPGPVISSQPISRTASTSELLINGSHTLDASLYDLRLGPSFNIPLFKRLSLQAGGGLALGMMDSEFSFTEITPAGTVSGKSDHVGLLLGAYAEVGFAYQLCHCASLFTGAQFQYLGDFNQTADGRNARLDIGQTIFYEFGLQWHF